MIIIIINIQKVNIIMIKMIIIIIKQKGIEKVKKNWEGNIMIIIKIGVIKIIIIIIKE